MSKCKYFLLLLIVSTTQLLPMQHFLRKIKPANSKVAFGWGVNGVLSSIPLIEYFFDYKRFNKRKKEVENKKYHPFFKIFFGENEKNFLKRVWPLSDELKEFFSEHGIDPLSIHEFRKNKYSDDTNAIVHQVLNLTATDEGKIIISREDLNNLQKSFLNNSSVDTQKTNLSLFKILKAQKYLNNESPEKNITHGALAYTAGMVATQLTIQVACMPLSLLSRLKYISKASSYLNNSYIFNGAKGYLRGKLSQSSGKTLKYFYSIFEDAKSHDIDCEPYKKDEFLKTAENYYSAKIGETTSKLDSLIEQDKPNLQDITTLITYNIFPNFIKSASVKHYQEKNKNDHPEVFTKKN